MLREFFYALTDPQTETCLLVDEGGRLIAVNRRGCELLGLEDRECCDQPLIDFVHDDPEVVCHYLGACLNSAQPLLGELHFRGGQGEPMALSSSGYRVQVGSEKPYIFLKCQLDAATSTQGTALEESQEVSRDRLQGVKQRFTSVVDSLECWIYVSDLLTNEVLFINRYGIDLFGDVVGKPCWQVFQQGQSGPCSFCQNSRLLDEQGQLTGKTVYWEQQNTRNGRWYSILDRAVPWIDKRLVKIQIATDITEQKRASEALHEKTVQLDRFFALTVDLLCIADMDGHLVKINPAWERVLGYPLTELQGQSFMGYVHPEDQEKTLAAMADLLRGQEVMNFLNRYRCRDGSYRVLEWRSSSLQSTWVYAVARDVTEQKEKEREEILRQKLEATALLAGGIAHDFNNLLTAVCGNIELAHAQLPTGAPAAELLDKALQAAFQGRNLTSRFLTFSKGGMPVLQVTSLQELIGEAVQLFLSGSNIESECDFADDLWQVEADTIQLTQVFQNLINNAREAMPQGGKLKIVAANQVVGGKRMAVITFTDTGPGISQKDMPHVFDPYFSTKPRGSAKGMGLGLTIAKSIIQKHHGKIKIGSAEGEGTTVVVQLPAAAVQQTPVAKAPERTRRVLVMDDEPMVRELLQAFVAALGYRGADAKNGEEAIRLFQEAMAAGDPFHAVMLDLTIKGGMGGEQTISVLSKLDPGVRGVVISGYADHPVIARYQEYGFKAAIIKPCMLKEVTEVLRKVMG